MRGRLSGLRYREGRVQKEETKKEETTEGDSVSSDRATHREQSSS